MLINLRALLPDLQVAKSMAPLFTSAPLLHLLKMVVQHAAILFAPTHAPMTAVMIASGEIGLLKPDNATCLATVKMILLIKNGPAPSACLRSMEVPIALARI